MLTFRALALHPSECWNVNYHQTVSLPWQYINKSSEDRYTDDDDNNDNNIDNNDDVIGNGNKLIFFLYFYVYSINCHQNV